MLVGRVGEFRLLGKVSGGEWEFDGFGTPAGETFFIYIFPSGGVKFYRGRGAGGRSRYRKINKSAVRTQRVRTKVGVKVGVTAGVMVGE